MSGLLRKLKFLIREIDQDPRVGNRMRRLTNIRREEPTPRCLRLPRLIPCRATDLRPPASPVSDAQAQEIEVCPERPRIRAKNHVAYKLRYG